MDLCVAANSELAKAKTVRQVSAILVRYGIEPNDVQSLQKLDMGIPVVLSACGGSLTDQVCMLWSKDPGYEVRCGNYSGKMLDSRVD